MISNSNKSLQGKTALVTGAASGIGKATAELFRDRGATLVLFDTDPAVEEFALELRSPSDSNLDPLFICADLTDEFALSEAVALAAKRTGHLDIVVNAAASSATGTVLTMDPESWDRTLSVNLTAVYRLARACIPALIQSHGSLVLIGSQLGLVGAQQSVAYTASKGGLINLTRSLALDHANDGVRINCLCPGPTQTSFLNASFARAKNPEQAEKDSLHRVPMGRFAQPFEIATCAAFLASEDASFVTGAALVADGGYIAQ